MVSLLWGVTQTPLRTHFPSSWDCGWLTALSPSSSARLTHNQREHLAPGHIPSLGEAHIHCLFNAGVKRPNCVAEDGKLCRTIPVPELLQDQLKSLPQWYLLTSSLCRWSFLHFSRVLTPTALPNKAEYNLCFTVYCLERAQPKRVGAKSGPREQTLKWDCGAGFATAGWLASSEGSSALTEHG